MSTALITINNAKKHYLNKVFNLEIMPKDFIVIKGINGSGKTTLLYLLIGFITPDEGMIKRTITKIAYLPEQIQLPLFINTHQYLKAIASIKKTNLDYELIVALSVPLEKGIHQLSKGNKQKVAIIQTLIGVKKIVILDEPLSGLDQKAIKGLKKYLKKINEQGVAVIISTHAPKRFDDLATKYVVL